MLVVSKVTPVTEPCEVVSVKVEVAVIETELRKSKVVVNRSWEGTGEIMIHSSFESFVEYCRRICINNTTEWSNCETRCCICAVGGPFDGRSVSTSTRVCTWHVVISERLMCCHSDTLCSDDNSAEVNRQLRYGWVKLYPRTSLGIIIEYFYFTLPAVLEYRKLMRKGGQAKKSALQT